MANAAAAANAFGNEDNIPARSCALSPNRWVTFT